MSKGKAGRELEQYRNVMEVPSTFEDGFNWTSLIGAFFIGLVMVPGAMYMQLVAGLDIGHPGAGLHHFTGNFMPQKLGRLLRSMLGQGSQGNPGINLERDQMEVAAADAAHAGLDLDPVLTRQHRLRH